MNTIKEIENYIEEQEPNGALLVTGKWGSGKTYLIHQVESKLNREQEYLMAVVSLFGIEDTNILTKKVKEAVAYAKAFNKVENAGKRYITKGVNIAKQLSAKAEAFGELFGAGQITKMAKSANMLLSIDIYDFLSVEKKVCCVVEGEDKPVEKELILVFDEKHFRLFDTDNLIYDFHLRKESAAIGKADAETLPATDRDGLPRKKEQPAAGGFEYKEE